MTEFLLAVQFLTIIPVKAGFSAKKTAGAVVFFPVIGLLLGLILAGTNILMAKAGFDTLLSSAATIVLLVVLTGGIHMDGLADTADALASGKDRKKQLKIMRDPHIGSMGALALVCVIVLKIILLNGIPSPVKPAALILMCVLGRWAMVFIMHNFTYARKNGKAKIFMQGLNRKKLFFASLFATTAALIIYGVKGLVVMAPAAVLVYIAGRLISNKMGGITGDVIGTANELTEVLILSGIYTLWRLGL